MPDRRPRWASEDVTATRKLTRAYQRSFRSFTKANGGKPPDWELADIMFECLCHHAGVDSDLAEHMMNPDSPQTQVIVRRAAFRVVR